jgi:thiamine kinase-like enzyme
MTLNNDYLRYELSKLLSADIASLEVTLQENKYSSVYFTKLKGSGILLPEIVLKESISSGNYKEPHSRTTYYDLYKFVLKPLELNSPQILGFIEIDGKRFLATEYISHQTHNWDSLEDYKAAVNWLIKKDNIFFKMTADIDSHGCIREHKWVHEQCLSILEEAYVKKVIPYKRYDEYHSICNFFNSNIRLLDQGRQTVSHNDFHLGNILFGKDDKAGSIYVVDWTLPNKCSVTFDLACLVYWASVDMKGSLVDYYRQQIHFPEFDKLFEFSTQLVKLIELAWLTYDIIKEKTDPKMNQRLMPLYNDLLTVSDK